MFTIASVSDQKVGVLLFLLAAFINMFSSAYFFVSAGMLFMVLMSFGIGAYADVDIHVSPRDVGVLSSTPRMSFGEFKQHPDTTLTLNQALVLLKDPTLRDGAGAVKDNINIRLENGIYRLNETVQLDALSSGSNDHPIHIIGSEGGVTLSGGRSVNGFTSVLDPAILARLPAVARGHVLQANLPSLGITSLGRLDIHGYEHWGIPADLELFYLGRPMPVARWPNVGFVKIASTPDGTFGHTFTVDGRKLDAWAGEPNPMVTGYWFNYWSDGTLRLKAINAVTGLLTLTPPGPKLGLKPGQPVFFHNILAELDQPGEWYLDRKTGTLYFWPPQALRDGDVEVSVLDNIITINGASHILLTGLIFENARGTAITIQGGDHISVGQSIIRNIGNAGAFVYGHDNGLVDMHIENIGETGVMLQGGDRATLTPGHLYVENSTIQNIGRISRTYTPAIRLAGVGNRAIGNRIFNAPHSAIIFNGNNHLIMGNDISDVCKETGDAGAIYTGGDWTARGTDIVNNYLHDIPPNWDKKGTMGVYLDDQASGVTIRGNQFLHVQQAVIIGGGRDNIVENNIFIDSFPAIHLDARGLGWQKAVTNDTKGIFRQRLSNVPYNQPLYSERYPHLADILEDEPGMPKYNVARHNCVIGGTAFRILNHADEGINIVDMITLPQDKQSSDCFH